MMLRGHQRAVRIMTPLRRSACGVAGINSRRELTRPALTVPAVIIGGDADGLGNARCLGRAGVPVIVVETDRWRPGMHSQYVQPFVAATLSGQGLIDSLLQLRASLNVSPLLFLTTDPQVRTISEHRSEIEGAFRICLPEHDCIRGLLDKWSFQSLAELHGFSVPRSIAVCNEQDCAHLSRLRFPAVIKPANKELFLSGKAPRAQKVQSLAEAESICRTILPDAPNLIVQEWVEGEESDIYFCLQYRSADGRTVSSFVGRKLRSWPPQTGSTASCTAAPEAENLLEKLTTNFFDATHMTGMCSMEFKKDRNSGRFFMIEPTVGRTDWQEEVASLNGVNIPLAAYCYELGLSVPEPERSRRSFVWIHPPSYLRSICADPFRAPRAAPWRIKCPFWSLDDLVPSLFFAFEWLRKFCSRSRWRDFISERESPTTTSGKACASRNV